MNQALQELLHDCTVKSLGENLPFPEIVGKLTAAGIESYHVDLYRREKTAYLPSGESHRETMPMESSPIGGAFAAEAVVAAIRAIQQRQIGYREFLRRVMAAGTTQYWVYLQGRCAVYTGRNGEAHVERFPQ
jgi:uncharacterized protein YbcV (DUF1398 family)